MSDRYAQKKDQLPISYVEFVESHDGWEGDLGARYGYVVIWAKESIQDRWQSYEMAEYLPDHWFPFGSNGGGEMLCFDLRRKDGASYLIPYIGMSEDEAMEHCATFGLIAAAIERRSIGNEEKG